MERGNVCWRVMKTCIHAQEKQKKNKSIELNWFSWLFVVFLNNFFFHFFNSSVGFCAIVCVCINTTMTLKWCAFVCTNDFSISFVDFLIRLWIFFDLFAIFLFENRIFNSLNWNSTAWEYKMENLVCVCVCVSLWVMTAQSQWHKTWFRNNNKYNYNC